MRIDNENTTNRFKWPIRPRLQKIFNKKNIEYIATDYKELDITSDEDLNKFFQENEGITHVINCAAYNDVDKAGN